MFLKTTVHVKFVRYIDSIVFPNHTIPFSSNFFYCQIHPVHYQFFESDQSKLCDIIGYKIN